MVLLRYQVGSASTTRREEGFLEAVQEGGGVEGAETARNGPGGVAVGWMAYLMVVTVVVGCSSGVGMSSESPRAPEMEAVSIPVLENSLASALLVGWGG